MTQFPAPPDVPSVAPPHHNPTSAQPPYSGAAIAGFVLSLLGCAGITAVLGFILGVVGILSTSGGRRRGMGLAIAAIPISLITGALSIGLVVSTLTLGRGALILVQLPEFLSGDATRLSDSATSLREFGSDGFQAAVSEESLTDWLVHIAEKHGAMTEMTDPDAEAPLEVDNGLEFEFDGTFENGLAPMKVRFVFDGWTIKLDDIEIDGVSPKSMKE